MNLRILKKLSKQAVPLLAHFGVKPDEIFLAKKDDNYFGINIMARKHWDRCRSVHADCIVEHEIKRPARDGNGWVYMHPPHHPLKGTPMVGRTTGYYEPEWDERTAFEELQDVIQWASKPKTMTDAEWARAQKLARIRPYTDDDILGMLADLDEPSADEVEYAEGGADHG